MDTFASKYDPNTLNIADHVLVDMLEGAVPCIAVGMLFVTYGGDIRIMADLQHVGFVNILDPSGAPCTPLHPEAVAILTEEGEDWVSGWAEGFMHANDPNTN